MTVYLASYKGTHAGLAGLANRGIRLLDKTIYSHSEICIGNPFECLSECHSSSGVDGGVRMKSMQLNPEKWDVMWLPFASPSQVRVHYQQRKGVGYDYWGTGRFAAPWMLREHPTKDFCSEFCGAAIGIEEAWRLSPAGLKIVCAAMGGVMIRGV